MTANRDYLRGTLIPKLKKLEASVETRDIWKALVDKNRSQNESALSAAAEMQSLLHSQLRDAKQGEEMTQEYAANEFKKATTLWNIKVENEILDKLIEL